MGNDQTTSPETRAQLAYTAYVKSFGFTDAEGEELPTFIELSEEQRIAWRAAAAVVWDLAITGKMTI